MAHAPALPAVVAVASEPRPLAAVELAEAVATSDVPGGPDVQSPWEIAAFLELKTVWHPIGV